MVVVELAFSSSDPQRLELRPAHRAQLRTLHEAGELLAAGPLGDDSGAVLIFDVDRARLDQVMAADPYYTAPGVTVVSVRDWTPVIAPPAWSPPG